MKWPYPFSLASILAVILEAYGVQESDHTLRAELMTESVTIWSGYGALAASMNEPYGKSKHLGTEEFGGSWPGPRWQQGEPIVRPITPAPGFHISSRRPAYEQAPQYPDQAFIVFAGPHTSSLSQQVTFFDGSLKYPHFGETHPAACDRHNCC
jgi:hypothetical protein